MCDEGLCVVEVKLVCCGVFPNRCVVSRARKVVSRDLQGQKREMKIYGVETKVREYVMVNVSREIEKNGSRRGRVWRRGCGICTIVIQCLYISHVICNTCAQRRLEQRGSQRDAGFWDAKM